MVYPAMILNLMPVGLLGLMLAVLFAALTSTPVSYTHLEDRHVGQH